MAKSTYERRTVRFTQRDVDSAVAYSQSGAITGKIAEWRDLKTVGLTLRITPRQAIWYVRRRDATFRMGFALEISLDKARYIAEQTRLAAKRKRDLRVFFDGLLHSETNQDSYRDTKSWEIHDDLADDNSTLGQRRLIGDTGPTWTWEALTNEFLRYKRPKLKKAYQEQYEHYLRLAAFKSIEKKLVSDVTLGDLERVRDAIEKELAPSAVHRALTQSKRMLSWAWKFHATRSGLEACEYEWWLRWSYEYKTKRRTRAPTLEEIARTLLLAENAVGVGGRHPEPGTLGALWAVALTAQRTGSLLVMRPDRLFVVDKPSKKLRGWKVANWTAEEMKGGRDGGRPHSLPLPKEALGVLARFHQQGGQSSPWMFPSRDRTKHVTQDALNLLIYRMQGRVYGKTTRRKPDRPGKPGPKPTKKLKRVDLFKEYGIRPWTAHDVRRTLTTFLDDNRLGGAATAILGHKFQGENVSDRERIAPITQIHYNQSQKIDLKAEGMALWVRELLRVCSIEARTLSKDFPQLRMTD